MLMMQGIVAFHTFCGSNMGGRCDRSLSGMTQTYERWYTSLVKQTIANSSHVTQEGVHW